MVVQLDVDGLEPHFWIVSELARPLKMRFSGSITYKRRAKDAVSSEAETLSCLNRCMPKEKLNLFKFSARQMA
jgi:hypothetical protein